MGTQGKDDFSIGSRGAWTVIALAVYIVRVMPWALSEFWYDEVLTITHFAIPPEGMGFWEGVFRNYPIANNHILSSAIYWCWLRILNFGLMAEQLVRLPSIFFGGALIVLVSCHWRKWIGAKYAVAGSLLLAISPVFTAYAYQVRGYSLSMFLAGVALSGALENASGRRTLGAVLGFLTCLLLPLTIPSNVIFVPLIALLYTMPDGTPIHRLLNAIPSVLGGLLGGSYYLTLWDSFVRASKEPGGWDSPWAVVGNIILAVLAHLLVVLATFFIRRRHPDATVPTADAPSDDMQTPAFPMPSPPVPTRHWPAAIAVTAAILTIVCLLVARSGQAPYPRVFLVFLPAVTLAALLAAKASPKASAVSFPLLAVAILANGVIWERTASALTDMEIAAGRSPNNLLMQYYRGAEELRDTAAAFSEEKWMQNSILISDQYDQPTMNFYWKLYGGPNLTVTLNLVPKGFWTSIEGLKPRLWAVAKTPENAAELFDYAGCGTKQQLLESLGKPGGMTLVINCGRRGIYVPPMPNAPVPHVRPTPKMDKSTLI